MALYTDAHRKAVIARAREAVQARAAGKTAVMLGAGNSRQTFDLNTGGYCNRFVRQCFETALGLKPFSWYFGAAKAKDTLRKLSAYKVPLADRQPGDILGFPGNPGHIAIYLGKEYQADKELIAENTSATRGFPRPPGTKVTSYAAVKARISGCYRLFDIIDKG